MNRKATWLLTSFLGMTATSYSVAARSFETPQQTWRTEPQQLVRPDGARRFTDMYSVTWEEIPMPESTPADPHMITADSIANDGTIAGRGTGALVFWHPDTQAWEEVPKELGGWPVFISPDGSLIVTTDYPQTPNPPNILTWNRAAGWQALAGSTVTRSGAYNVSRNFRFAVGGGSNNGEAAQAWVWAIDGGVQQLLPHSEGVVDAVALAVSDNGDVVIGNTIRPPQTDGFFWNVATRWVGGLGLKNQVQHV